MSNIEIDVNNVANIVNKHKSKKKSNLVRDFLRVFPNYFIQRFDRIPLSKLESVIVRGKVETVTSGHDQREIPEQQLL